MLNPKRVHRVAQTLRRSKTDAADAQVLAEYSRRMDFVPWQAPSVQALQWRWLMRHLHSLGVEHTRSGNRLHAASRSTATARCVLTDLKRSMAALAKRIATLRRQARLLVGMPGIAELSALQMLAELAPLAEAMSVRQWVAHSGLDPAHQVSGTSVHKPSRISRAGNRHLRRALFMPALTAARRDPHLKAFYQGLLERQ